MNFISSALYDTKGIKRMSIRRVRYNGVRYTRAPYMGFEEMEPQEKRWLEENPNFWLRYDDVPYLGLEGFPERPEDPISLDELLCKRYELNYKKAYQMYIRARWYQVMLSPQSDVVALYCLIKRIRVADVNSVLCQDIENFRADIVLDADIDLFGNEMVQEGQRLDNQPVFIESTSDVPAGLTRIMKGLRIVIKTIFNFTPNHYRLLRMEICDYDEGEEAMMRDTALIPLDCYLLPRFPECAYEYLSDYLLWTYYPEMIEKPGRLDGDTLAWRMGLRVFDRRMTDRDSNILGLIFFNGKRELTYDEKGNVVFTDFARGDILINTASCTSQKLRNSTIVHECCHAALDQFFFLLQDVSKRIYVGIACREVKQTKHPENIMMDRMERQARKLPAYLMMPSEMVTEVAEDYVREHGGTRDVETIEGTVRHLMDVFDVSRQMAIIRMKELGYPEVEAIDCYSGSTRHVSDYKSVNSRMEGVTYTIPEKDALELFTGRQDLAFLNKIYSGKYIFLEDHFCLNTPKYVMEYFPGAWGLTPYARKHLDECCIGFIRRKRHTRLQYVPGIATRSKKEPETEKYFGNYSMYLAPDGDGSEELNRACVKDFELWSQLNKTLPDDFEEAVQDILGKKNVSQERLADMIGTVDRDWVYRFIHRQYPKKTSIVAFCIALELPFMISMRLVELADHTFRAGSIYDGILQMLLAQSGTITVGQCNEMLLQMKYEPLIRSKEV